MTVVSGIGPGVRGILSGIGTHYGHAPNQDPGAAQKLAASHGSGTSQRIGRGPKPSHSGNSPAATATQGGSPPATQAPGQQPVQSIGQWDPTQDPTYNDTLARLMFNRDTRNAGYQGQITTAGANRDAALARLDQQLPEQRQKQMNAANSQGLLESGANGQRLGVIDRGYAQNRSA